MPWRSLYLRVPVFGVVFALDFDPAPLPRSVNLSYGAPLTQAVGDLGAAEQMHGIEFTLVNLTTYTPGDHVGLRLTNLTGDPGWTLTGDTANFNSLNFRYPEVIAIN